MSHQQEHKHENDHNEEAEEWKRGNAQSLASRTQNTDGKDNETRHHSDDCISSTAQTSSHSNWCRCNRGRKEPNGSPSKHAAKSKRFRELDAALQSLSDEIEQMEIERELLPQCVDNCKRLQLWSFVMSALLEAILIRWCWPLNRIDRFSAALLVTVPVLMLVLQGILRVRAYLYTKKSNKLEQRLEEAKTEKKAKVTEAKRNLPFDEFVIIAGKFDAESDHSMLKPDIKSQQKLKEEEEKRRKLCKLMEQLLQLNFQAYDAEEIRSALGKPLGEISDSERQEFEKYMPSLRRVTHQTLDDKLVRSLTSTKKPRTRRASAGMTMRPDPRNLAEEFSGVTGAEE
eukprot:gb/GECG01005877.1/.p1 GENE.gb/GECG01005877.1/~~gb/GECG01005877.1/.p1  ORF type:complete len:343 (+),score=55.99 gb/GECG01005877.1/:1-1029(+)